MVTVKLHGRLGNQAYLIAATIATALRNGDEYLIPRFTMNKDLWPLYFDHLPQYIDNTHTPISKVYTEDVYFNYKPIEYQKDMCLSGYFQQMPYFEDYLPEIRKALKQGLPKVDKSIFESCVSIHARFGDFETLWAEKKKHPPITEEYLRLALNHFEDEEQVFHFFTDDINEAISRFGSLIERYKIQVWDIRDPKEAMAAMSACTGGHIIANSTFSLWAALLDDSGCKVVAPSSKPQWWHGEGNNPLNTDFLLPESWIQIEY